MGKVYSGGFEFPTGVKRQASQPLDDSEIVEFLNDLKTLDKCYPLIIVGVLETETHYKWNGQDQTNLNNWTEVGASTTVNNTLTSTSTTEALSANQGRVVNEKADSALAQVTQIWSEKAQQGQVDAIQSELSGLAALLDADDVDLDTAQERIDFIKNLASELEGLQISDIENLQTTLNLKQNKTGTSSDTGQVIISDNQSNNIVTLNDATSYAVINEASILGSTFQVQITTKAIGAEVRFTGDSANLEYNSLTDNKIVFTDRNMSVFIFKNDEGKFCWRVIGSTLPVQLTSENIISIVEGAGFSSYPKPFFNNLSPLSVPPTQSRTITINGAFFKEPVENMLARFVRYSEEPLLDGDGLPIHDETKVIRELQVNSLAFVNDSTMEVNITGVNIHDVGTHGTDAFELDGTTEINNQYWLLLHNGATRIFQDVFTISSGDIYIPKAGLTTDMPVGDWEHVSGSYDISNPGFIQEASNLVVGKAKIIGFTIPPDKDYILEWKISGSDYTLKYNLNPYKYIRFLDDNDTELIQCTLTSFDNSGDNNIANGDLDRINIDSGDYNSVGTMIGKTFSIRRTNTGNSSSTGLYINDVLVKTAPSSPEVEMWLEFTAFVLKFYDITLKVLP